MKASRRTQPFRKGKARPPGGALTAMLRGATLHGRNPADTTRALHKAARKRRRRRLS